MTGEKTSYDTYRNDIEIDESIPLLYALDLLTLQLLVLAQQDLARWRGIAVG
jgi:hypothetical protein